jgi:hypothetical protein
MAREKKDYREQLALMIEKIDRLFPENLGYLKADEVAKVLDCNVKTVYARASERRNPLPSTNIGGGKKTLRFPIAALVRWSLGA